MINRSFNLYAGWLAFVFLVTVICLILIIPNIEAISTITLVLISLVIVSCIFPATILLREHAKFSSEKYEAEQKLKKLFDDSSFCMVLTDSNMKIVKANKPFCKMLGYEEKELISLTFRNFTESGHISENEHGLARLASQEISVYQTEKPYIHKSGNIIWGSTNISTVRNSKGELQSFLAMIEDITARKNAEARLEKSLSVLKATIESTADGLLVVDLGGKIVQYNRKFSEMWCIPVEVLNTEEDDKLLMFVKNQLNEPELFLKNIKKLYGDKSNEVTCDILEFRDGRFFERFSQPQVINGAIVGRVWSFRDITDRKRVEAELIAARDKAEEGDKLKTAFLHNVSHEIRTPMNAIIGFSTLLNERGITEVERHQYAGIISDSSNQLLAIINDIVDTANIESGQVKANLSSVNLNSILRSLNEQFSYQKDRIVIDMKMDLPDDESWIITDYTKLLQILSNLVSNSFKFTPEGRIEISYRIMGKLIEFKVSDTGIGISSENISKIFTRFYQVEMSGTRKYGGTGLGLSICQAYINLLGGNISVESEPAKGTTFIFTIPFMRDMIQN
jgi:PAS domain S-box-containing protein